MLLLKACAFTHRLEFTDGSHGYGWLLFFLWEWEGLIISRGAIFKEMGLRRKCPKDEGFQSKEFVILTSQE